MVAGLPISGGGAGIKDMDFYESVRRMVMIEGVSRREAAPMIWRSSEMIEDVPQAFMRAGHIAVR
jgi:hypothetical protein